MSVKIALNEPMLLTEASSTPHTSEITRTPPHCQYALDKAVRD